jgi:hypothetical protein
MTHSSKEEIYKKWAPILENIGLTGSKADWMSEYVELQSKQKTDISEENTKTSDIPLILPMVKRVAAQTIGLDLVTVSPLGGGNSGEEMEKIRQEVKTENRDRKIESVVEGKEYNEMKPEEHPDYIKPVGPSGQLFYIDYKYGDDIQGSGNGRRNKKKNNGGL